jgi:glycerol kinase
VLKNSTVKKILVDGGFSKNVGFMKLLASIYPHYEIYGASVHQASALGAALILHESWNEQRLSSNLIELKRVHI